MSCRILSRPNRSRRFSILAAFLATAVLPACKSTPSDEAFQQTIENLEGTNEELSLHVDRLTTDRAALKQEVGRLNIEVERFEKTKTTVEDVKGEISAEVRKVLAEFQGDADVEVERSPDGYRLVLREAVLFAKGSAELSPEGHKALAKVAAALKGGTGRVSIEGHTDNVKVTKPETLERYPLGNIELSAHRALAVWAYLTTDGGVDAGRLAVVGFGPHQPRVPNDSERNQWRNRRVEIRVTES